MNDRPRIVSWNITAACNLRCPHCYLDAGRRAPDELSTEEALHLIDGMAQAGTELLILTGGEPLLRADLPLLATRAAGHGIAVVLGTNGTLLTRQRARVLKASGVAAAGISIDALDPVRHDAFRGVSGAWERAVQGIEACRTEGLEVLVHTTALKMNRQDIPALVRFAHEHGARAFHLFFLVCTGRGERLTDLSPEEYEEQLAFILDAQQQYPGMMVRARCAPYIGRLAVQRGLPVSAGAGAGCMAATGYCRITPQGAVTPCPYLPTEAGSVRGGGDFAAIWESSPVLTSFRAPARQLGGKCGTCRFSQGDDPACIGCRARAFALESDALAADPWCLYEPAGDAVELAPEPAVTAAAPVAWSDEARARLGRVPFFIRGRVERSAEAYVREQHLAEVNGDVLEHLRQRSGMPPSHPPPAAE